MDIVPLDFVLDFDKPRQKFKAVTFIYVKHGVEKFNKWNFRK